MLLSNRQAFFHSLAQTSYAPMALEIERAEGVFLYSPGGKAYIDLISGVSVSNLGHGNPQIIKAIREQLDKHLHLMVYGEYIMSPQVRLAQKLADSLPEALNNVYFTNSGSEAVEGALKLAKRATGRFGIIAFKDAYHGHTAGALSVMGNEASKRAFRPLLPGVKFLDFNDFDALSVITASAACVIVEPVQGEAGIRVPRDGFLQALRRRCDETGALLIFDEVQTGFGRTGSLYAMEKYSVIPDIVVFAKAMGGGMPIGAFVAARDLMQCLAHNPQLGHITTFGGHPLSCAAALASLEILSGTDIISRVDEKASLFASLLNDHPKVKEIRYSGLMMAVELEEPALVQLMISSCMDKGILLDMFLFCPTAFRIAPPLVIAREDIMEACRGIRNCLDCL